MGTAVRPVHRLGNISQLKEFSLERQQLFFEWSCVMNRPVLVMQGNAYTCTPSHASTAGGATPFS
jgi:hypothetical protein